MNTRCAVFSLLALILAAVPAMGQQTLYSNGAVGGSTDSWTINFGFVVSDTFTLSSQSVVNELVFNAWTFSGDVLENAQVQITSSEFGGTTFSNQVVSFTQSGCSVNQYGFSVCVETGMFPSGVNLAAGTYWLNLDNAVVNDGDPIFWDENSGPSHASQNNVGTIPSESFTVLGSSSAGGSVPEPGSILLLGSGVVGFGALVRRKLL
jgi:PEP-CTERM motif